MEDHEPFAERFARVLDETDPRVLGGSYALGPPPGRFKWLASPQVAIRFLREQAGRSNAWRPDIILLDFYFEGFAETGLSVAAVAHECFPRAQLVAFSGQASDHGRWLFHAAMHHWFHSRHVLLKTEPTSAYAHLVDGFDTTPVEVARLLKEHASLIDLFFYSPATVTIFSTWDVTRGQQKVVGRLPGVGSDRSAVRRIDELAQLGATFSAAFGLTVFTPPGESQNSHTKPRLGPFIDANRVFFNDPNLREIVQAVRPWDRVQRSDVIRASALAGHPVADS